MDENVSTSDFHLERSSTPLSFECDNDDLTPLIDAGTDDKVLREAVITCLSSDLKSNGETICYSGADAVQDDAITSTATPHNSSGQRSRHESYRKSLPSNGVPVPERDKDSPRHQRATLFDYVYSELRRGYVLKNDEQRYTERREKFYIFMKIPVQLEKVRNWFDE